MPPIQFLADRFDAGKTVADMLKRRFQIPWAQAKRLVERGHIRLAGMGCTDPATRVRRGNRVWIREGVIDIKPVQLPASLKNKPPPPANKPRPPREPKPSVRQVMPEGLVLVYADAEVLVVDKPAGLTTARSEADAAEFGERGRKFLPKTLFDWLPALVGEPGAKFFAVHRLDRDTTGLVAFARTPKSARDLAAQFQKHTVDRRYLALTRGVPKPGRIESVLVPDRGDGRRGSGPADAEDGRKAVTTIAVVERFPEGTLVECRLETGRTHQVRIHLGEAGAPLCGERVYDRPPHGQPRPDASKATRPMLHAASLGFAHPLEGNALLWEAPVPVDFAEVLGRLRDAKPTRFGELGT